MRLLSSGVRLSGVAAKISTNSRWLSVRAFHLDIIPVLTSFKSFPRSKGNIVSFGIADNHWFIKRTDPHHRGSFSSIGNQSANTANQRARPDNEGVRQRANTNCSNVASECGTCTDYGTGGSTLRGMI